MGTKPRVLVVHTIGGRDDARDLQLLCFCEELCDELAAEPSVTLAARQPLDAASALQLVRQEPAEPIVVVIGSQDQMVQVIPQFDAFCPTIPPIPVAFDKGTANLELRKASRTQVVYLVRVAVRAMGDVAQQADDAADGGNAMAQPGQILQFDGRERRRETPLDPAQLPAAADRADRFRLVRQVLVPVVEWADAATAILVDLWFEDGSKENAVYGLSWEKLLTSVERLLGIQDASTQPAHDKFLEVRIALGHPSVRSTPLATLVRELELDDLALKLVMIVLAPELNIRFQRLFGALHEDMGRRQISLSLACAILAAATAKATPQRIRSELAALGALRDFRLIDGLGATMAAADEPLRIDPPLLDWLVTGQASRLTAGPDFSAIRRTSPTDALDLLPTGRRDDIEAAYRGLGRHGDPDQFAAVLLTGSEGGWIDVEASVIAETELRIGSPADAMPGETLDRILREAIRAARLLGRRLVIEIDSTAPHAERFWRALAPLLPLCPTQPLVIADNPAWLLSLTVGDRLAVLPLPPVQQADRVAAIRATLAKAGYHEAALPDELADRFRVPLAVLPDAVPLAVAEAARAHLAQPGAAEWKAAFRRVLGNALPRLARRVAPRDAPKKGSLLDRVVLPDGQRLQLETLVSHVRVGGKVLRDWQFGERLDARGVSALFTGESGTGKTTAAHAVASELGADLYVVDLARIVSKYIGETEKNLESIFTEAERAGAVLLFDEADALFGKRSAVNDAHDRYANIEVAYLLQRVEAFDGLAILTTNHPGNIDPAFARRLRFTVTFPFPTTQDRLSIWEQAIPRGSPHRDEAVDFTLAARRLEVTGGSIKQMVLHALMAAATTKDGVVRREHLQAAARTELLRLGRHDKLPAVDALFQPLLEDEAA